MGVSRLWYLRTQILTPKLYFRVSRRTPLAGTVCSSSTQARIEKATFQLLPGEELVPRIKSRLKDRPFMVGSTGEGFPEFLAEPRESFPRGVLVNNPHQASLAELATQCMEYVKENLTDHPAILFRNLPAKTVRDFSIIAQEIPRKRLTYEGGTSFRTKIDSDKGIYTANYDPDEVSIDLHNEMAYTNVYPSKVFFFCLQEPGDGCGGETPLAKNSELLSSLNPDIVRKFEEKLVRYVRYLPDKSNGEYMTWQYVHQTEDRQVVEELAKGQGYNLTWDPSGDLYAWQNRPPFIHHPITGKKTWFNQVTTLHGSYYQFLAGGAAIPDDKYPSHTFYGDGELIEPAVLQHLLASGWSCAVGFKWRKGDLLVLDNLAVQHGRVGFKGDRKLLIYMTS